MAHDRIEDFECMTKSLGGCNRFMSDHSTMSNRLSNAICSINHWGDNYLFANWL
jgi:hypothetical protein